MSYAASFAIRERPLRAATTAYGEATAKRLALRVFTLALVGEALAAYNIGFVPIPWLAQATVITFVIFLVLGTKGVQVPGFWALGLMGLLGLALTLGNVIGGQFSVMMPIQATTEYPIYIGLRFLSICGFASELYLVYWLLCRGCLEAIVQRTTLVGVVCATVALYIYVAQLSGLPEPPRNRMGTGGDEQAVTFTYAFHRAMGTFQEPGDLASWLVLPLFLSFLARGRYKNLCSTAMGAAILLSGSLAAIAAAMLGFVAVFLIVRPFHIFGPAQLLRICVALALAGTMFAMLAVANDGGSTDLIDVLTKRIEPILENGMEGSNRDYVFEYVADTPYPILGPGFGNGNLLFTECLHKSIIVSFISLYFYVIYSLGLVGFAALIAFLINPLLRVIVHLRQLRARPAVPLVLLSAFVTWLIMFGFRAEEFPPGFGITYALLAFAGRYPQAVLRMFQS